MSGEFRNYTNIYPNLARPGSIESQGWRSGWLGKQIRTKKFLSGILGPMPIRAFLHQLGHFRARLSTLSVAPLAPVGAGICLLVPWCGSRASYISGTSLCNFLLVQRMHSVEISLIICHPLHVEDTWFHPTEKSYSLVLGRIGDDWMAVMDRPPRLILAHSA